MSQNPFYQIYCLDKFHKSQIKQIVLKECSRCITGTAIDPTVEDDLLTGGGGLVSEPLLIVAVPPGKPTNTSKKTTE